MGNPPLAASPSPSLAMAEKGTGSGGEGGSTLDSTLQSAEENLASLRRTLEAIEGLETRWKVLDQ